MHVIQHNHRTLGVDHYINTYLPYQGSSHIKDPQLASGDTLASPAVVLEGCATTQPSLAVVDILASPAVVDTRAWEHPVPHGG